MLRKKALEHNKENTEVSTLLILHLSTNLAVHSNKWYSRFKYCDSLADKDQRFRKKSIPLRTIKPITAATAKS